MRRNHLNPSRRVWGMVLLVTTVTCWGDTPSSPKPSTYAPVADLAAQIELLVKQLDTDLGEVTEFGEEQQMRVARDANTLIALAQVAANHDQDHPVRAAAPAILAAATKLVEAAEGLDSTKAALAAVKLSLQSKQSAAVAWEPQADLAELMKQVPIVNNKLRAGVTGRRFDRTLDQNAGYATTLAAIAQVSQFDTAYCSDEVQEKRWAEICVEMRTAAAEVQTAIRKKDQATAKSGLDRLVKTCDVCHAEFRD